MINYDLKRPQRLDTRRIEIDETASIEELQSQFLREFTKIHARLPQWTPSPISKEWLIDQLLALDWYLPHDLSSEKPVEQKIKQSTRKKVKEDNPFK